MVNAVLFDLDGTLWDRDGAVDALLRVQHAAFTELAAVPREQYVSRMLDLDARGLGDKRAAYAQLASERGLDPSVADKLVQHFWVCYHSFFEPFPEVLPTLRALRASGLKLGIITNGQPEVQDAKIHRLGLTALMDTILVSGREGVRKPDPAIFARAVERLGVSASETWFVGDHPEADIRGAQDAGMTTVWRRSWGITSCATYAISALDELIPLLRKSATATPAM